MSLLVLSSLGDVSARDDADDPALSEAASESQPAADAGDAPERDPGIAASDTPPPAAESAAALRDEAVSRAAGYAGHAPAETHTGSSSEELYRSDSEGSDSAAGEETAPLPGKCPQAAPLHPAGGHEEQELGTDSCPAGELGALLLPKARGDEASELGSKPLEVPPGGENGVEDGGVGQDSDQEASSQKPSQNIAVQVRCHFLV